MNSINSQLFKLNSNFKHIMNDERSKIKLQWNHISFVFLEFSCSLSFNSFGHAEISRTGLSYFACQVPSLLSLATMYKT